MVAILSRPRYVKLMLTDLYSVTICPGNTPGRFTFFSIKPDMSETIKTNMYIARNVVKFNQERIQQR